MEWLIVSVILLAAVGVLGSRLARALRAASEPPRGNMNQCGGCACSDSCPSVGDDKPAPHCPG